MIARKAGQSYDNYGSIAKDLAGGEVKVDEDALFRERLD